MNSRLIIYLGILITLSNCKNKIDKNQQLKNIDEIESKNVYKEEKSSETPLWVYHFDDEINDFKIKRSRDFKNDTLTPSIITKIINKSWPKVQIKLDKIDNDTAFVFIPESNYLTQSMGTTGAEEFMVSCTYSFTELTNVNYVKFKFIEGDHAVPGVYSRTSWKDE